MHPLSHPTLLKLRNLYIPLVYSLETRINSPFFPYIWPPEMNRCRAWALLLLAEVTLSDQMTTKHLATASEYCRRVTLTYYRFKARNLHRLLMSALRKYYICILQRMSMIRFYACQRLGQYGTDCPFCLVCSVGRMTVLGHLRHPRPMSPSE